MQQYKVWDERPRVVQNLFNPAFCGLLLWTCVNAYNDSGMDYPLVYVALPLVLHRGIRRTLPSSVRTTMPAWIQKYPEHALALPDLIREIAPFTADGLLWALNASSLRLSKSSARVLSQRPPPRENAIPDDTILEVSDCVHKAAFVGKWLARTGSTSIIFTLMGVRP